MASSPSYTASQAATCCAVLLVVRAVPAEVAPQVEAASSVVAGRLLGVLLLLLCA
jgi:hypothetical protein